MINWKLKSLIVENFGSQANFAMQIKRQQSYVSEVISGRRQLSEVEKKLWAEEIKRESKKLF